MGSKNVPTHSPVLKNISQTKCIKPMNKLTNCKLLDELGWQRLEYKRTRKLAITIAFLHRI